MNITRGKITKAVKVVVYGPEGIGKSTFASKFPNPLFIDTEGSTNHMDLARFDKPSSWTMLNQQIQYVKSNPDICDTLVIDTIDWAEQLCVEDVCARYHKSGIEEFGYGNGYVYTKEEFGRFLNRLEDIIDLGINVVLTAHAQMRKFEQPDEMGAYDRWELKLGKKTSSQTSPLVKEWADMLLFTNYKVYSVAVDDKGKKHKAQGGKRVMYTAHHPCWDAKNRFELSEEMDFDYSLIAHCIPDRKVNITSNNPVEDVNKPINGPTSEYVENDVSENIQEPKQQVESDTKESSGSIQAETAPAQATEITVAKNATVEEHGLPKNIPKELTDLMVAYEVSEKDIQEVVASRGYYPIDTPIENYDPNFIKGCLVAAWSSMYDLIKKQKEARGEFVVDKDIPFNFDNQ